MRKISLVLLMLISCGHELKTPEVSKVEVPPEVVAPFVGVLKPVFDDPLSLPATVVKNICGARAGVVWVGLPGDVVFKASWLRDHGYWICQVKTTGLNLQWQPRPPATDQNSLPQASFSLQFAVAPENDQDCLTLPWSLLVQANWSNGQVSESYLEPGDKSADPGADPYAVLNQRMRDVFNANGTVFGCMAYLSGASNSCGDLIVAPSFIITWSQSCADADQTPDH